LGAHSIAIVRPFLRLTEIMDRWMPKGDDQAKLEVCQCSILFSSQLPQITILTL